MSTPIIASTQDHLEIEDVLDNIIILKDGSAALVIKTNAINFGLLSEEEQDATIYAYASMLNSLTFSVQVLIRSELKDISGYIRLLEEQEAKQLNQRKKDQIVSYKKFITSLVTEHNVLDKKFYLVIPFSTLELGVAQSMSSSMNNKKRGLPFEKNYILEKAKTNLEPKRDHLLRQLGRLGLAARQLNTQELIQLLFSMYNPTAVGQKVTNTKDYTVPLVQPAYANPKEETMSDITNTPPIIGTVTPPPTIEPTVAPIAPEPISTPPMPLSQPVLESPTITPPTPPTPSVPVAPTPTFSTTPQTATPNPVIGLSPTPTTPSESPFVQPTEPDPQSAIDSAVTNLGSNPVSVPLDTPPVTPTTPTNTPTDL